MNTVLSKMKEKIKRARETIRMMIEFHSDYKNYKKWSYNSTKANLQEALSYKILRQAHMIEKGMSLTSPKKGFGEQKIRELLEMLDTYVESKYNISATSFQNALNTLNFYVQMQESLGYSNAELNDRLLALQPHLEDRDTIGGIKAGTSAEMKEASNAKFLDFFASRHSMRQFSLDEIKVEDIEKAVDIARKAPSACNRQPCKVYYYTSEEINQNIGRLIAGNTGFEDEAKKYLVITADVSAFYDAFERNQLYIDAGIFILALTEALHYLGIGSCILQNGERVKKNRKFKEICDGIAPEERIVAFLAIGYYKEKFTYAISNRKKVNEILRVI